MPVIDIELSEKLAISCNILALEGHGNLTLGHVTARSADQPYLHMNPHDLALEEVTPEDLILIDLPDYSIPHPIRLFLMRIFEQHSHHQNTK